MSKASFGEESDGLLPVSSDGHVEAFAVETDCQRVDEGLLVLDEQDVDALSHRSVSSASVRHWKFEGER